MKICCNLFWKNHTPNKRKGKTNILIEKLQFVCKRVYVSECKNLRNISTLQFPLCCNNNQQFLVNRSEGVTREAKKQLISAVLETFLKNHV